MAEEPSLAPQWLKSGIATPSTSSLRTEEGGEVGGRPAALPSPRVTPDGPGRDPFAPRRSSDWTGKPSQVAGQSGQPSWDKPSLRAHHRGGAHRNIFEDHSHDIFGPSSSGASKHSNPHHHRAGPSTPSSPYRPGKEAPKDFTKDFSKESGKDYGGAWTADPHQGQAGSRAGNPRDRPVNARGPVLNGAGSDGKAAGRGAGQRPQQALDKDFLPSPRVGHASPVLKDLPQPLSPARPSALEAVYTRLADNPGSPQHPFSPTSPLTSPAGPSRQQPRPVQPVAPASSAPATSSAPDPSPSPRLQRPAGGSSALGASTVASSAVPAGRASAARPEPAAIFKPAAEAPTPQRHGGWVAAASQDKAAAAAAAQKEPSAAAPRSGQVTRGWAGLAASAAANPNPSGASANAGPSSSGAAANPAPASAASAGAQHVTRMADAISQQQVTTAAAMQQVASERQREEKLLARQAKLIPVAFSGPRPRQGVASHLGDRAQGAKPSTLTGLGPTASSKALLGVPRSSGLTEGRGAAPTPAANRRSSMPEEVPVSSGPTPLTLSFSVPSTDKPGMNGQQSNLARASSDVERNTRQAILSPTKAAPAQNGLPSAAASAKPPGTPTGLQNKAKERNSFFQSLRRTRTATGASERPSSSSSLSPASSLDAPSLATSGRAETGDTPGLSSLSERVQEQLASEHAAQNGFHAQIGSAAMDRQQEGHGSSLDDAEVLKMLDMTAEDLAFMRRLGWTPEPASSEEAGGLTDEEIQAFREQQKAKPTKVVGRMPAPIAGRPRSAPYPCPPVSPWRSANGSQHLANLDVGSYGSKLSDSESEPE
ncbi:hypothetical protein WJX74_001311 [Apatococcus lobatus]|uniref:Uncharacterized protein n=1 Tax=Apatococcus lobatus TaxID=904363 RepID=A0AAW1RUX7_9CHLO